MPFQPPEDLPDFLKLKAIFNFADQQIKNNPFYQTIIQLLDSNSRSQDLLNKKILVLEAEGDTFIIDVRDVGYWTPLILDGSDNGDSEMVLTDVNEPIAVWNPTP